MAYDVAQAYVQILPSTEKFGSTLKNDLGDSTKEAGQEAGSKFGTGLSKGLKVVGAATAAAGAAVSALTTSAVAEFAEYEQLVGGVNKLFGDMDYQTVVDNASEAFRTAGMSSNEYMKNVTGFSAALIAGLGDDTAAAAGYADMAIRDMSDNANVFGTDIEAIQNAYQGFAKQNYTMLDNLKLGYGGTKTEMERLISDANAVKEANGDMADLSIDSFADVVEAIHIMQDEMSISGTTAKEASSTISGSVDSMKSAWHNLLIGLADDNQDFGKLVDDLIGTIVGFADESGERVGGVINNIMPRVETALQGISELVTTMVPEILGYLPGLIENLLPDLIEGATSLITSFIEVLPDIISAITDVLPDLLQIIGDGIVTSMSTLTEKIPDIADALSQTLSDVLTWVSENAGTLIDSFADFLSTLLTEGIGILSENTDELIQALYAVIEAVVKAAIEHPELIAAIVGMSALKNIGSKIIGTIGDGLNSATTGLTKAITSAVTGSVQNVNIGDTGTAVGQSVGNKIISGLGTVLRTAGQSAALIGGFIAFDHVVENLVVNNIKGTEMWQQARQEVDQIGESAMSLSEKYDYLNSKVGGNLEVLREYVPQNNALLDTMEAIGGPLDKSTEGWLGVAEAMGYHGMAAQGVAQNLQMMYGDLWNEILAEEAAQTATEALGTTTETTAQQIGLSVETLSATWSATFQTEMPAALQEAATAAANAGVEIPSSLIDNIVQGIANGSMTVDDAVQQIVDLMDKSVEAGQEGTETGSAYTSAAASVVVDERPAVEAACNGVAEAMDASDISGQSGTDTGTSFNESLAGTADGAANAAEQVKDAVTNTIEPLPGEMNAAGDESGSNLESAYSSWQGAISGAVDETYNFFYDTLGSILTSKMYDWGYEAGTEYRNALDDRYDAITGVASNIASGIETEFDPLPGWLESAGYDGGAGLYSGFQSWEGALYSLANNIAWNISSTIRAAFNSHSPSRVTMAIGEDVGEGLAIGIEHGGDLAITAAEDVSYDVIDAASHYDYGQIESVQAANDDRLSQIVDLLDELKNLRVVMDSGEVVGVLAPELDNELERRRVRQGRG